MVLMVLDGADGADEPVNEVVHAFAQRYLCRDFVNSYWGTEHGGIVWSMTADRPDRRVPNAHTACLPWIDGDVDASVGSAGETVIASPFPYQGRTVWGDAARAAAPGWSGDATAWARYFDVQGRFVQGDSAVRHADGTYTFHGRSDDVMNVGGNRVGIEPIENALLKALYGRVRNAVVFGASEATLGECPIALVVPSSPLDWSANETTYTHLVRDAVSSAVGRFAVPRAIVCVDEIPVTLSGKYPRGLLKALYDGFDNAVNTDAMSNPECVAVVADVLVQHRCQRGKCDHDTRPDELNVKTHDTRRHRMREAAWDEHAMRALWIELLGFERVDLPFCIKKKCPRVACGSVEPRPQLCTPERAPDGGLARPHARYQAPPLLYWGPCCKQKACSAPGYS